MISEEINGDVANGVIRRMMEDSAISHDMATRMFNEQFARQCFDPPPVQKRYRSTSHCPNAGCMASNREEAREFFRKLLKVEKLPDNFRMVRY